MGIITVVMLGMGRRAGGGFAGRQGRVGTVPKVPA